MKDAFKRARPRSGGERSFPSGHAMDVGFSAGLIRGNLRSTPLPEKLSTAADVGLYLLQGAGAWSRVEAGAHYPADVLVGLALGQFIASFVNDAFLHDVAPRGMAVTAGPAGSLGLGLVWSF
jgi:membrane-associated phospholipid phosphatase